MRRCEGLQAVADALARNNISFYTLVKTFRASIDSMEIEATVGVPAPELEASTTVVAVYPTTAIVPENLLRFYISFSAPMSLDGSAGHVRLLDGSGHDVEEPFLPLDVALWNEDRTRYTLLLDPGRVKRGILPNLRMGRAIAEGSTYTLVVEADLGRDLIRIVFPQNIGIAWELSRWTVVYLKS